MQRLWHICNSILELQFTPWHTKCALLTSYTEKHTWIMCVWTAVLESEYTPEYDQIPNINNESTHQTTFILIPYMCIVASKVHVKPVLQFLLYMYSTCMHFGVQKVCKRRSIWVWRPEQYHWSSPICSQAQAAHLPQIDYESISPHKAVSSKNYLHTVLGLPGSIVE